VACLEQKNTALLKADSPNKNGKNSNFTSAPNQAAASLSIT
jgi:hypothetical protein